MSEKKKKVDVLLKKETYTKLKEVKEKEGTPMGFQIDRAILERGARKTDS